MEREIKCEYCGKRFFTMASVQKYCSKFCKRQASYKRFIEGKYYDNRPFDRETLLKKQKAIDEVLQLIFNDPPTKTESAEDLVAVHCSSGMYWVQRKNAPKGAQIG